MVKHFAFGLLIGVVAFQIRAAAETNPVVDPQADELLRRMSQTLAQAQHFTLDAHSAIEQVTETGQKIEVARNQRILVSRPDRAMSHAVGDQEDIRFVYDGKRLVVFNSQSNAWAQIDAPPTIDQTLDLLAEKYGLAMPLADVIFSDPYVALMQRVVTGQHLGEGYVFDEKCQHLAFTQENVDWQIWISDGEVPLPRKVVITYKLLPTQPRFTAYLSNWNLSATIADSEFGFTPPADARQVDLAAPTTQSLDAKDENHSE